MTRELTRAVELRGQLEAILDGENTPRLSGPLNSLLRSLVERALAGLDKDAAGAHELHIAELAVREFEFRCRRSPAP